MGRTQPDGTTTKRVRTVQTDTRAPASAGGRYGGGVNGQEGPDDPLQCGDRLRSVRERAGSEKDPPGGAGIDAVSCDS